MSLVRKGAIYLLPVVFLLSVPAAAASLATSFVDVVVGDVELGKPRRVEDHLGNCLLIWNRGETPIVVQAEALKPTPQELQLASEPIEDVQWIQIRPTSLELGPHGSGRFDVTLQVPKNDRLRHRTFQAMIWSRSTPTHDSGVSFSAGLKSRLRFTTK